MPISRRRPMFWRSGGPRARSSLTKGMTASTFGAKFFVAAPSPSSLTNPTALSSIASTNAPTKAESHRALFLQAQRLPPHRHPIRQAGREFLGHCSSRRSRRILAQLSLAPSAPAGRAACFLAAPSVPSAPVSLDRDKFPSAAESTDHPWTAFPAQHPGIANLNGAADGSDRACRVVLDAVGTYGTPGKPGEEGHTSPPHDSRPRSAALP